jgi:hypothetical protein
VKDLRLLELFGEAQDFLDLRFEILELFGEAQDFSGRFDAVRLLRSTPQQRWRANNRLRQSRYEVQRRRRHGVKPAGRCSNCRQQGHNVRTCQVARGVYLGGRT